ncbi:putative non-specific lipid-transfer protein-like protein-like [Capsicum annuum]|nr:putative non-specific lipid-transfer protein-like protein-like [Capsicum annuum]
MCTDVTHINEELPIKLEEKLMLIDKENDYFDISLRQLNLNDVDNFMKWHADDDKVRSQRVLEKVGFTKKGVLRKYYLLDREPRDVIMFNLLSTDPQPQLDNLGPNILRCAKSSWEEE